MRPELPVRSVSVRFNTSRYLRLRSRVLTASRAVTYRINLLSHLMSDFAARSSRTRRRFLAGLAPGSAGSHQLTMMPRE